jgi:preprotein translocase subunit SecF
LNQKTGEAEMSNHLSNPVILTAIMLLSAGGVLYLSHTTSSVVSRADYTVGMGSHTGDSEPETIKQVLAEIGVKNREVAETRQAGQQAIAAKEQQRSEAHQARQQVLIAERQADAAKIALKQEKERADAGEQRTARAEAEIAALQQRLAEVQQRLTETVQRAVRAEAETAALRLVVATKPPVRPMYHYGPYEVIRPRPQLLFR